MFVQRLAAYPASVDSDIREGDIAGVHLKPDEPRIGIFGFRSAPELLDWIGGIGGELGRRLPVEQHLICAVHDGDVETVPDAGVSRFRSSGRRVGRRPGGASAADAVGGLTSQPTATG